MHRTSRVLRRRPLLAGRWAASAVLLRLPPDGPEDPSPIPSATLVVGARSSTASPTVRQRRGRPATTPWSSSAAGCAQGESYSSSRQTPGALHLAGVAHNVPVNFPPRDQPYLVRVSTPTCGTTPTGGVTAERLRVGGEALTRFDESAGTPRRAASSTSTTTGSGHNPF